MILALLAATILMADSATALQVATATPAASSDVPPAAAAPGAKAKAANGDKLICRNEPTLGTRLPTKKCRTAAQMAEQARDSRATLEKLQTITPENTR